MKTLVILIGFLSFSSWGYAQLSAPPTSNSDSTNTDDVVYQDREQAEKTDWRPKAIRIGADLAGPTWLLINPAIGQFEGLADVQFNKYHLVVEGGYSFASYQQITDPSIFNYQYGSSGTFWRAGIDANLFPADFEENGAYMGIRYAQAQFTDVLFIYPLRDPNDWPDTDAGLVRGNENARAQWFEAVASLKVQVISGLNFGYSVRYRFGYSAIDEFNSTPYHIPGMGRPSAIPWRFNAYLMWRIPFKLKPLEEKAKATQTP